MTRKPRKRYVCAGCDAPWRGAKTKHKRTEDGGIMCVNEHYGWCYVLEAKLKTNARETQDAQPAL